jgi:hypothetical protein
MSYPRKLNLGCSDDHRAGYLNVDVVYPADLIVDLCKRWPWPDSYFNEILAYDVAEHIDNDDFRGQKGIIWFMNEAHRVLAPGGKLDLKVPSLPGEAPFVDPTHVSVWTSSTRYYFDERWNNDKGERGRLGPAYGITALFRTLDGRSGPDWMPIRYSDDPNRYKIMVTLEAVKETVVVV